MHITLIAAVAENRAIGLDNQLIYHIREDQRRFKSLTAPLSRCRRARCPTAATSWSAARWPT